MDITVRKAKQEDISQIIELDFENFSNVYDKNFYIDKINFGMMIVAQDDKKIVGFILFNILFDESEIYKVVVSQEYRRKNIARSLMENYFVAMKENCVSKIFLEVRESNKNAIKLYRKFGFRDIKIIENYYSKPLENGIAMIKEVEDERCENIRD